MSEEEEVGKEEDEEHLEEIGSVTKAVYVVDRLTDLDTYRDARMH